ncbi:cobalt ECF transporter T component CbiQ [Limnospira platensis]|uniref:cobalt ECF transporter T component CbiQ n=1 Tax=Limnospira platensis TaxID=118562 RepID=UPI003D6F8DD6
MHHQIDAIAYTNRLRYLPSEHKLTFAATLFCLSLAAPPLLQILITIWVTIWVVIYAKIPLGIYLKLQAIPFSFWLTSIPALLLGVVNSANLELIKTDIIWGFNLGDILIYFSNQGMQQAGFLLTRSLVLTSCMYFILLTTPLVEIIRIFRKIGCPSLITELLMLMYRFIFMLTETASQLLIAQQVRIGYGDWKTTIRSLGIVTSQLLQQTLENYRQICLGLTARGFNGELRVWSVSRHQPNPRYTWEGCCGCLLLLVSIGWFYVLGI